MCLCRTGLIEAGEAVPNLVGKLSLLGFYALLLCRRLALGNNIVAMKNISDTKNLFPKIRVWGTIGWIVAGLYLSWISRSWDCQH